MVRFTFMYQRPTKSKLFKIRKTANAETDLSNKTQIQKKKKSQDGGHLHESIQFCNKGTFLNCRYFIKWKGLKQ